MPSVRVVLFIGDNPFYLSGFRNSETHIRGMVENGGYSLYIVKQEPSHWVAYNATAKRECRQGNRLGFGRPIDGASVTLVKVPETMRADYNTIINWARNQKREKA